ncbi:hypothetical protein GT347_16025 [Xylophilus rhododendri]|uniref:Uncharacterized protein n=1 Tax=Xylophilus rhododendri TaxID=2697032 RepID=A0A857J8M0_9BURK|nr:hypothetical protein [Xylophilus rhododendri]QHI99352.1 hypothetical protein GT347_16025 [Xylophilus rhododendri]
MAILSITEFAALGANSRGGLAPVAAVPPAAQQTLAIAGASAASVAFSAKTNLVRLCSDVACYVEFATSPTASATKMRLPAGVPEYFGVQPGKGYKVAVIAGA